MREFWKLGNFGMNHDWLRSAAKRYDDCNRATLEFILSRAPLKGAFVDTKVHSISGENYDGACGIRGPEFTFGWIQGRALEALMTFARFYHDRDPDLSRRLVDRARLLFDGLDALFRRDGHVYFLYDRDLQPVRGLEGIRRGPVLTISGLSSFGHRGGRGRAPPDERNRSHQPEIRLVTGMNGTFFATCVSAARFQTLCAITVRRGG